MLFSKLLDSPTPSYAPKSVGSVELSTSRGLPVSSGLPVPMPFGFPLAVAGSTRSAGNSSNTYD